MTFIAALFKDYRNAISASLLWGFCFLLGIINQWPYFWRRSFSVQFLLSVILIVLGAVLFFLSFKKVSQFYTGETNRGKLLLIFIPCVAGIFLTTVLFRSIGPSQYPFVNHTLTIRATDTKHPASDSTDVRLLGIQINGKRIALKSLEQMGDWSKEESMLRGYDQAVLTYAFMADLDPDVQIQFERGPSAGMVQIELDGQEPILQDLYSDRTGHDLFILPRLAMNVKSPLFLFVILLFIDYTVIFWLLLCFYAIAYVEFRKHAQRVEENTAYSGHGIDKSSMARAIVLLAPLCYFLYYILQGKLLLLGNTDRVDAQLPYLFAAKNALAGGQLPWWNPYIFNGTPIWGNPAIFLWYPFTWIELLVPRSLSLYVSTLISWLHYGGVFWTGFLYFRALIRDEKWAAFSSLAYGFSISVAYGLSIGNAHLPIYLFLPLCLYILHTHDQRTLRRNIIYLILILYFMITGGFLQLLIYAMAIIGSYVLFLAIHSSSRSASFSLMGAFSGSLFVAVLLSAPVWLSILYMASLVSRVSTASVGLQDIFNGSTVAPINELLRLLMPNGFGFGMYVPPISYVETVVAFCGISSLFLAGIAVVSVPGKLVYYWAGIIISMFLLCFTKLVFLQKLVFGGVEIMPERLLFMLPLAIAALAGIGGRNLFGRPISRLRLLIFNPFNILLCMVIFSNFALISENFINVFSIFQQYTINELVVTRSVLPEYELIRAAAIILALILFIVFGKGRLKDLFWGVSISLMLFEVIPGTYFMHKVQLNPLMVSSGEPFFAFDGTENPLPFSTSELEAFRLVITEKTPSRRSNDAPPYAKEANQGSIYHYQSPWGYANGYSSNLAILVRTVGAMDIDTACQSGGLINGTPDILNNAARQVIFDPLCHPRLADLLSVGAVFKADADWQVVSDRREQALPRLSLFYDYEVISDSVQASNRLAEDDFDIHKTLIVEKRPLFDVGPVDLAARSVIVKNTPNEVIVQVDSAAPVLLLLTDTFSPGWSAEMNQKPIEIIRSNVAFRSVGIPKGNHTIVFHYDPPGLPASLALVLLGVIGFLGMVCSRRLFNFLETAKMPL
jgi:hypothetical protein